MTLLLAVVLLAACASRKTTVREVVHDTLVLRHTDTLWMATRSAHADTVRETVVRVLTLRQDSTHTDTVRVEVWRDRWRSARQADTAEVLRHRADTVVRGGSRSSVTEKVRGRGAFGRLPVCLFVVLLVLACAILTIRHRE